MSFEITDDLGIQNLLVLVGSLLVTNKFRGTYVVKDEIIDSNLKIVKNMAFKFQDSIIKHVPKEDKYRSRGIIQTLF